MNILLDWHDFIYFAIPTVIIYGIGAYLGFKDKYPAAIAVTIFALIVFGIYIGGMWHSLERPPMRTMGETRLWYSFFVIIAGLIIYTRWRYRWILSFSTILSTVFICINIFKPEIHSKTMMPALESPFFVPHVISYIFAYGMLGAALLLTFYMLYKSEEQHPERLYVLDNLVYTGTGFLIVGLLLGAIWAKQAWGTYWGWDPKETWAAITMAAYMLYIHHRRFHPTHFKQSAIILIISFLFLQMCWYGINFLPSAADSIHMYSN
ncbi:cytochrome c biogenesis protein [Porphyromonas sp.]|uniref:cytochrome c biogenesis protein n=1 Tax=Porphyromonas sp. TaxID=1924944 RepID=UPI0026DB2A41|nr:cytochrome c biogenesis protein CcsA [Porphyromonas sp.]MDO4695526.1 cytochrome c biogenesis protein CcsA [Porphyromonas sp.]MDO4771674.1 cytochrome c biogenesis protein CcsA [Porphyromonas sp.]